jgi:hypothetical protein
MKNNSNLIAFKPAIVRITRKPIQYMGAGYSKRSRYQFSKSKTTISTVTASIKVNIAPSKKLKIDESQSPDRKGMIF